MSVSSRENYRLQGAPHTKNDVKVTWREIETAKREIANHTKAITNIFRMGEDWGEKGEWRVRRAMNEQTTVVPQMHCTQKDHKELPESGVPKSRPICDASSTMNQRISNTITEVLQALTKADNETCEVVSTEDLLSCIEDLNKQIRDG